MRRALALMRAYGAVAGLVCAIAGPAAAQPSTIDPSRDVGLDQKNNAQVPLDASFVDEKGKPVLLGDYFGEKPVVLTLVWFKCPGICPVELEALVQSFQNVGLRMGKDYRALTVSINPKETSEIAAAAKARYASQFGQAGAEDGWHFLTGTDPQIHRLASAVGFRYAYDAKSQQYAHPAGVIILTPQGKVSRYLFGLDYPPKDLRFALNDATKGKTGSLVDRVLILTCYHYDAATGRYTVAITKILQWAGVLTMLIVGGFLLLLTRFERRRARAAAEPPDGAAPAKG